MVHENRAALAAEPARCDAIPAVQLEGGEQYLLEGGILVEINLGYRWSRDDFAYLGLVRCGNGRPFAWAWHEDGRSIDRFDRAFDIPLIPRLEDDTPYSFWLGREAAHV